MSTSDNPTVEVLKDISRTLELLVKLKIHELKGDQNQSEMIRLLDSFGFKSGEIIRLLGASQTSVRPILSRARKRKTK